MRKTQKAMLYPNKCAVSGRHDGEMIDTGITVTTVSKPYRIYLRQPVVEEMGKKFGMVKRISWNEAQEKIAELEAKIEADKPKVEAATRMLNMMSDKPAKPVVEPKSRGRDEAHKEEAAA